MTEIKARYIGVKEYYAGAPARDLTEEEYERLAPEVRKLVDEGSLYEVVASEVVESKGPRFFDELPMVIADALVEAGYERLADVAGASDEELLAVDGIGAERLAKIRELIGGVK